MQENRISARFKELARKGECALVCYVVAGYPDVKTSQQVINALVKGGADIIEIGIPFSDPIADGPTIQAASNHALEKGVTPEMALSLAKTVRRQHPELPLLAMTYANILVRPGMGKFMSQSKDSGIDGFILPDMPVEEASIYLEQASDLDLSTVFLASPNTPEPRLKRIVENSTGFLYMVSVYGITGARRTFEDYTLKAVRNVKLAAGARVPIAVGFGISTPAHARFMIQAGADAVIVGSAIIDRIAKSKNRGRMLKDLEGFARSMKKACKKQTNIH